MLPTLAVTPMSRIVVENVTGFLEGTFEPIHEELFEGLQRLRG